MYDNDDNFPVLRFAAISILVLVIFVGLSAGLGFCGHAASIADQATLGRVEQNVQTKNYGARHNCRACVNALLLPQRSDSCAISLSHYSNRGYCCCCYCYNALFARRRRMISCIFS